MCKNEQAFIEQKLKESDINFKFLLYIPPICCLNGLFARGELFHPRYLEIPNSLMPDRIKCLTQSFQDRLKKNAYIIINESCSTNEELLGFVKSDDDFYRLNIPYKLRILSRKRQK